MIVVGALLVVFAALALIVSRGEGKPSSTWDDYLDEKHEGLAALLAPVAKRLSTSRILKGVAPKSIEGLESKLNISGAFGGSLNIFLSYQLAVLLIGGAACIISMTPGLPGLFRLVLIGLGVILALWPYSTVKKIADQRANAIRTGLPDFAEVLLMVLSSMSVPQALNFTASRLDGAVAAEMRDLVQTLSMRSMPEDQAFDLAAARLGTTEGKQFVAALKIAYIDGAKAVEPIRAQVDSLRQIQFQHQRAVAKRLPVRMVVSFAIHFMPLLFILAFLPVFYSLSGVQ